MNDLTPEIVSRGQSLLLECARVVEVTTEAQQQLAVQVGRQLAGHLNIVEKLRQALVAPHIAEERAINDKAREHSQPISEQKKRIAKLVSDFDVLERQRVEAELRHQKEEFERLERERKAVLAAAGESLNAQMLADQRAHELEEQSRAVITAPVQAIRTEGMRVTKEKPEFEVVDVKAAYAAAPHLFKDPEPRRSVINSLPKDMVIPGIRRWVTTDVSFTR